MELQKFIDTTEDYLSIFKKNNFKIKKYTKYNCILVKNNYNQPLEYTNENDYWKMYCRGAIIDTHFNKVICLPPVKSVEVSEDQIDNFSDCDDIQSLMDGTMINLFHKNNQWILSTRSEIGGYNKWNNKKSFRQMFDECCSINYDSLNKNCSYSFVMRHKENRNIAKISDNVVLLVEVYDFSNEKIRRLTIQEYPPQFLHLENINYNEFKKGVQYLNQNYNCKGYTFKQNSKRYKILNPLFLSIKELKINSNNDLMNYIELRKNGLLSIPTTILEEKETNLLTSNRR